MCAVDGVRGGVNDDTRGCKWIVADVDDTGGGAMVGIPGWGVTCRRGENSKKWATGGEPGSPLCGLYGAL